jgi:hypothetical protein
MIVTRSWRIEVPSHSYMVPRVAITIDPIPNSKTDLRVSIGNQDVQVGRKELIEALTMLSNRPECRGEDEG